MARRRAIGLVTSFISGRFFEQVLRGIQQVARQHQVDVVVVHGTPEHVALSQVGQQHVDGWLVLTYTAGLDLLVQQGKPIVTISGIWPGLGLAAVLPDNRGGMEAAMEHLLGLGHTRIAFVGDTAIGDIHERYLAYQAMLERAGLPFDPGLVIITDNPLADRGVAAAGRLLDLPDDWTAVVAGNDWTAIGLMRGLQARGIRIPEDIALVGFDDIPEAQVTNPPLSTVRQHSEELGASAARLLLGQITGVAPPAGAHYVPTTFVARDSSGDRLRGFPRARRPAADQRGSRAADGPLWAAELAADLVRLLLPALPDRPVPSPVQVWPEVDRLVRLLAATSDGTARPDTHKWVPDSPALQAVFASPPMLNASAEILAELLRALEVAGMQRCAIQPDPDAARERLSGLLDQLLVEAMRSYRRRQNAAGRTLSEVLQSQYNISQHLLQHAPQQLGWLAETAMDFGCLGLWTPNQGADGPLLSIAGCYQRAGAGDLRPGASVGAAQFPPLERLPAGPAEIATWLVLPVRAADHDWGLLAVAGTLISADPWLEDNTVNVLEVCCSFLGIMLEREALQESLRYAAAAEQSLSERVRALVCPLVRVAEGVLLVPLAGPLGQAEGPQMILEALQAAGPAGRVLLDAAGLAAADSLDLAAVVRRIARGGAEVTLLGASAPLLDALAGRGLLVSARASLAAALADPASLAPARA